MFVFIKYIAEWWHIFGKPSFFIPKGMEEHLLEKELLIEEKMVHIEDQLVIHRKKGYSSRLHSRGLLF